MSNKLNPLAPDECLQPAISSYIVNNIAIATVMEET